jgi:APA family basic amino acid/polyamine antiporter
MSAPQQPGRLKRELGVFHAVLLGLGSILGTGVFVSIGIAAGIAGPSVLIAIVLAALLALCNGLSSAQLAAAHPVAGGTYEYGYQFLHPKLGFTAGWMFLLAKSASAATAALGVTIYIVDLLIFDAGWTDFLWSDHQRLKLIAIAAGVVTLITACVLMGIRRASWLNVGLVSITIVGLLIFTAIAFVNPPSEWLNEYRLNTNPGVATSWLTDDGKPPMQPAVSGSIGFFPALMLTTALMFVAYTGYGRIATLGEEVHQPKRTIPLAILTTLAISAVLYLLIGQSLIRTLGTKNIGFLQEGGSGNLLVMSLRMREDVMPAWRYIVAFAAITAMLGVLLNLVLGLSRVLLAMGRRHDVYPFFANVNASGTTPVPAVIGVGLLIAGLTLIGDVKTTWTFSAFTVLIYYGITNLAALKLPKENRLYPRFFSWAGLGGCFFLCWWVEPMIWLIGLGLIALGLVWHTLAPVMFGHPPPPTKVCTQCGYDLRASQGNCPECGQAMPKKDD